MLDAAASSYPIIRSFETLDANDDVKKQDREPNSVNRSWCAQLFYCGRPPPETIDRYGAFREEGEDDTARNRILGMYGCFMASYDTI